MNGNRGELPQTSPELPTPIGPKPSPFWPRHLWDLYVYPRRFFSKSPALAWKPALLLVVWTYGISVMVDAIDQQMLRGSFQALNEVGVLEDGLTWGLFWSITLVGGALSGALLWWLGGWWYRMRLHLSDAQPEPDKKTPRLLMAYSSFIFGGPLLLFLAAWTTGYPSYDAYWADDSEWGSLVVVVFVFWSLWTSYAAVTSVYQISVWKARIWFVFLPAFYYLLVAAVVLAVFLLQSYLGPDMDNIREHNSTVKLSYPGNWELSEVDDITIEPPQDAAVMILSYVSDSGLQEELADSIAVYEETCNRLERQATFSELGSHTGAGAEFKCRLEGSNYTLRIFVADSRPVLEVREIWLPADGPTLAPGLALIRDTLTLTTTESELLGATFLETAEAFRAQVASEQDVQLDYNLDGVEWLDEHINSIRRNIAADSRQQHLVNFGSFLGQAIIQAYDASWINDDELGYALELPGGTRVNPFHSVADQIDSGEADSVLFVFKVLETLDRLDQSDPGG